MSLSVLSVWKSGSFKDFQAITLANDELKITNHTMVYPCSMDKDLIAIDYFSEIDYEMENSCIYMTHSPNEMFVKTAEYYGIQRIVFIDTKNIVDLKNKYSNILCPFNFSFGKIIDVLEQFCPNNCLNNV